MAYKNSSKRRVETFIVAKTGQAFYNTSGSGNHIVNQSTGAVRLADGQIGIFSASANGSVGLNVATDTTPVIAEVPSIYLAQGTASSANPQASTYSYPLFNIPYIKSADIDGQNPVFVTKQPYSVDTHSVWVVGSSNSSRAIVPLDNTEYQLRIGFRGHREDVFYSSASTATLTTSFTTPNYTTLATQDPLDHLIQNICWQINRNSKALAFDRVRFRGNAPVVALAINVAGNSNGTAIGGNGDGANGTTALAAGQVVPVVNTNVGIRSITLTEGMATSIKNAAVAAATEFAGSAVTIGNLTWNILTVDTTTAGLTTGGVADLIMLVGLDHTTAFVDTIPQVKSRLQVGLTSGFDYTLVNHNEYSFAFEGQGNSRHLDLLYKATMGQRLYNLQHTMWPIPEFPSPIVSGTNYTVYNLSHVDFNQIDVHNRVDSPQRTIVCIPSSETTLISALDSALNSWLASNGHANIDTL